jgi:hypothetical protein
MKAPVQTLAMRRALTATVVTRATALDDEAKGWTPRPPATTSVSSPLSHALWVVTTIPDELATSPPSSDMTLTL